jgi:hypothetical protein
LSASSNFCFCSWSWPLIEDSSGAHPLGRSTVFFCRLVLLILEFEPRLSKVKGALRKGLLGIGEALMCMLCMCIGMHAKHMFGKVAVHDTRLGLECGLPFVHIHVYVCVVEGCCTCKV